ncbi:transferrin-binding protein-like solute binding protein [Glaesserella parasuis]|uniref:transferrin-binding protein-like solute binding protein n=1 Tax=Glaesserella parasuis TaxID=738 RepID=UPI00136587B7|nr:transferrin-binding protein-like solute binding protein [Glaesserella parasuis]MDO9772161.1 transferrin-binding protein-like solute binding protein [Glaesserella parasuis]MDO9773155.1 transferrin-binding protein-like solute binding protein [Glaesserella parasuis]MDO9802894.1 transferrin-binding protein-like solute binding protein [Glaesserella parasuis]MDO9808165.1 transferrin-binding protein-like solute binding protein [Glaesserella parasuis]
MHFKLNPYALAFTSLFLVACSGGKGSFDLEDVQPNKTTGVSKEEYKDVETDKKVKEQLGELMEPALGYVVKVPVSQSGVNRTEISNPEAITDEDLNKIPNHDIITGVANKYYGWVVDKTADKTMKYVRSGYAIDVYHSGTRDKGYVFYKGITPSKELPQGPVLTYRGEWDFTSDANLDAKRPNSNPEFYGYGLGQRMAATSADAKGRTYTSEFEVDFSTKKLTGKLNSKTANAGSLERYSIEAELKGNRFRGKAIAKDASDAILGKSSDYLEGGFYGPKAEELAGKFITNDKSLFAVFSAKHNASNVNTVRIIDASKIDLTNFSISELNNFGDASVLIIDGKKMELAGSEFTNKHTIDINGKKMVAVACCSNLEYMKFGQLWQQVEGEQQVKDHSLFLQGERTATDNMPKGGNYKYIGTWDARVFKGANWIAEADNNRKSGYRTEFDVDFGSKNLSGKLFDKNGVTPVFTVDAEIKGNGFTGKAKTSDAGVDLDSGSSHYDNVKFNDVAVSGGFYGPTAAELGGQFHHKSDNGSVGVGAVFGAKQQVKK